MSLLLPCVHCPQGYLLEATSAFRDAITLNGSCAIARTGLANALYQLNTPFAQAALAAYRDVLTIDPRNTHATAMVGLLLYDAGNVTEAIQRLESPAQEVPSSALYRFDSLILEYTQ